jgi:ADP-ribose pyrophosphatase
MKRFVNGSDKRDSVYTMEETVKTLARINAKHFSAQLDTVRLRTGKITERIKIDHPEAAAIVPFLDADHILMVRQWRYALGKETLEIPAGKADPGEDIEVCARRELEEETGHSARRLLHLFSYYPAIGYSNELIRIYAASSLVRLAERHDVDEIAEVEVIRLSDVQDLILKGSIQDGKTVISIAIFRARMERGDIPEDFFG